MKVEVRLFGQARQLAGSERLALEIPEGGLLGDLWLAIEEGCRPLSGFRRTARIAINREFADANDRVRPGDEVALIPPVSGG